MTVPFGQLRLCQGGIRAPATVLPVVAAGTAALLVWAAVDSSRPWAILCAAAAVGLLGWIVVGQLRRAHALEEAATRADARLEALAEVVAALNASTNLGSTLGPALDRLLPLIEAEGIAVWLPAADDSQRMVLVEQRGLPDPEREGEWLQRVRAALAERPELCLRHPGPAEGTGAPARCVSVRMGAEAEGCGYLTAFRREGDFDDHAVALLSALGADIGGALRSVRMVSEARRAGDRDSITGLLNHRAAYQRLHAELERHRQSRRPLALLMLDLDNFKLFNDTYGHVAGDELLKRVTGVLRRSCREEDTLARFGGDEFMILLPNMGLKEATKVASRIQNALARERFRCRDSALLPIGVSGGLAVFPDDTTDAQELVAVADANLCESRAQGGNRITACGAGRVDTGLVYVKGFDLFHAMIVAIDNKDGYTRKHSEDVTAYSLQIARALELDEATLHTIQLAGMLHDIGKIGVPDTILRKPGKLTEEEFQVMRQHPVFGALIVGSMPGMEEVVLGVRHHHERFDGRGYPDGLAGDRIPLIGRIMAIADAFSAMTTSRPYRKGMTERQALQEIRRGLGSQFDPELGALFVRLREAELEGAAEEAARANGRRAGALVEA